jgi:hypothetical protein
VGASTFVFFDYDRLLLERHLVWYSVFINFGGPLLQDRFRDWVASDTEALFVAGLYLRLASLHHFL